MKTITKSFEEMLERNHSISYPAAYTMWHTDYLKFLTREQIENYNRWYDPSWTVPPHVQEIIDIYMKIFKCCKVVVSDDRNNVAPHTHATKDGNFSMAFTMCIPMKLNDKQKFTFEYCIPDKQQSITKECYEFDRLFFNSSMYRHSVVESRGQWYFIIYDYGLLSNTPDLTVDIRSMKNINDLLSDIRSLDNNALYVRQTIPEFNRLLEFGMKLKQHKTYINHDWTPYKNIGQIS